MNGRRASSWRLPGLWEEVRGARNLFEDSWDLTELPKPQSFKRGAIVVPGFLAPPRPYFAFGKFLNELGYGVIFPDFGGVNALDRAAGVVAVQLAVQRAKKYFKSFFMIGHSLGGIQSLRHAPDPAVDGLILMGSPFVYGTPWRLLSKLVLACLTTRGVFRRSRAYFDLEEGIQETMLDDIVGAAKPFASKIYSIALVTDPIAPPAHAAFPGGHNIVIHPDNKRMLQNLAARERGYWSHGGMVNLPKVREAVEDILT